MKRSTLIKRGVTALLCGAILISAAVFSSHAAEETPVFSYGISVLAAETDMAVNAPVGNDVTFSADDFERNLNLSRVEYITVRSLPKDTEGELLLGSTRVAVGQTVSRENISFLNFVPIDENIPQASFLFSANGSGTALTCNMYWMKETNYTPTVSMASGLTLNVSAYRDISVSGRLSAYDPDGDDLVFEIVSYPKNGTVSLSDKGEGSYVYMPGAGYVGSDSFRYVARDRYGNYSASATVNLTVSNLGISVTYADMLDSPAYTAALRLTEAGIMSGTQVGNQHYFYPAKQVSRAEFLVMAMNAAGITEVPLAQNTGFSDDASIPSSMKGYVAAAYQLGYISGTNVGGELSFLPEEEISRAEAAVILSNIIGLSDVPVTPTFADGEKIPVWAGEAIYSLNAVGILSDEGGYISPTSALTREQTAQILAAVMEYK